MTDTNTFDILISGGGIAGLTAAAAFGSAGFTVQCVDPMPPITERDAEGSDLRTTAFLQPARGLLDEAGLWARLDEHAAPLQIMRIVDAGGDIPEPRIVKDFNGFFGFGLGDFFFALGFCQGSYLFRHFGGRQGCCGRQC